MNQTRMKGSCLCGGVRYEVTGECLRFYHCHCSRCRKASGTGHASNLFVKGDIKFLSGADNIRLFLLPEAERFSNSFCGHCGARVPRFIEKLGMVFIPAGSLDDEPPMKPQARIFTGSRAEWSCNTDPITEFEEYPA